MDPGPRSLILRLLVGAGGDPLTARDAVRAGALFGIPGNAVRVALARLAAAGMVASAGRGAWRLGRNATALAADVGAWRDANRRTLPWSGDWVAVHVGALPRSDRVALRARTRALGLAGTRELERGLHVRPDNLEGGVAALRGRLYGLGLDRGAAVFRIGALDRAREKRARALWDGRALARGYRATRARLLRWLDGARPPGLDAAARESFRLGDAAIRQLVFDPLLPSPLVDEAARRAFVDALVRFDAAGHAIWRDFLRAGRAPAATRKERSR